MAIRTGDPGRGSGSINGGRWARHPLHNGGFSAASDFDHSTAANVLTPFGPMDTFILKLAQPTNGLNENGLANALSFYPNPVGNTLYMKADKDIDNINLSICDPLGKIVLEKNIADNTLQLNIESLSKGIYYLNISENGSVIASKKIIKE